MQNYFFIVNSRIGQQKISQLKVAIQHYLAHCNITIKCTEYGGHATVLAKEAILQPDTIVVAVGGDGTVNEVVQVMANTNKAMGIVPTGSGNGLARHCGIPIVLQEAVALLATGKTVSIDLGQANDIYFISNAGVGFDALVCNSIQQTKSRGLKMYVWKVIQHYFSYRRDEYTISTETKQFTQKAFFLNVANGREFGYGFQISPAASLQDGVLDVILTKSIHAFNGLIFVIDGWRKRLDKNKNCIHFTTTKIRIEAKNLNYFQTDGDAHSCRGVCEISVRPNALQLLVPQSAEGQL